MTVARQLADVLAGVSVADLPPQAIDHAAMLIASTIASAAAGTQLTSARIIRDLARDRGGRPEASLWFDADARLPIADAAQANAAMSDAAASDDSDLRNIVHAGTPLTAVSLAIAERDGIGGETVLVAIVCGYEAAGRISDAITPGFRARGFHGCHGAVFAAAVAAARLLCNSMRRRWHRQLRCRRPQSAGWPRRRIPRSHASITQGWRRCWA